MNPTEHGRIAEFISETSRASIDGDSWVVEGQDLQNVHVF